MAILKMKKINLLCLNEKYNSILKSLQEFSEIEFSNYSKDIDISKYTSTRKEEYVNKLNSLEKTIKRLEKYSVKKSGISSLLEEKEKLTYDEIYTLENDTNILNSIEEVESIFSEIDELKYFIEEDKQNILEYEKISNLKYTLKNLKTLKNVKADILSISRKDYEQYKDNIENVYLEELSSSKQMYFLSLIYKEDYDATMYNLKKIGFSEFNINLEYKALDMIEILKNKIDTNTKKIIELEEKIKYISNANLHLFMKMYEVINNRILKEENLEKMLFSKNLILLTAYLPLEKYEVFCDKISKVTNNMFYIEEEIIEDEQEIPIKLKNRKLIKPFEMLTSIYSMPKYQEVDPTVYLAPFFWFFFGMMIGDAMYGLVILLASLLGLYVFKLDSSTRNLLKLFMLLSFSVIIWGIIYGSYFGYEFYPLISITDDYNKVLQYAIIFGIIHVYFGVFLKGLVHFKNKRYLDILYDCVFWYVCLTSTILLLASSMLSLPSFVTNVSKYIMIISMILIILTGGREYKNMGARIGFGVYALYGITGFFGDFISYARLMALGLSGAFMSLSINQIVNMVNKGWYTIIFVILIFVMAHFMNLFLSVLGSYVHTSRLIYVEFFGKFYEGGGRKFKDFKTKTKYVEIEDK